jgi:hypothetical protein
MWKLCSDPIDVSRTLLAIVEFGHMKKPHSIKLVTSMGIVVLRDGKAYVRGLCPLGTKNCVAAMQFDGIETTKNGRLLWLLMHLTQRPYRSSKTLGTTQYLTDYPHVRISSFHKSISKDQKSLI